MAIDLSSCPGCGACHDGVYGRHNIPSSASVKVVAGPRDALEPRRPLFFVGTEADLEGDRSPEAYHQPVPACTVRERAVRGSSARWPRDDAQLEGLNEMTSNRCVGTHAVLLEQLSI